MKKVLKHILFIPVYTLLLGFLSPVVYFENLVETWLDPSHWLCCLIASVVVCALTVYFNEINPRTFYPCVNILLSTTVCVLSAFAFMIACILSIWVDMIFFKILLLFFTAAFLLLAIYAFCWRGVAVYANGKIRVYGFGFKVKTFPQGNLDNVTLEDAGRKYRVNFIINGEDHVFLLSPAALEAVEKRVKLSRIS